MEKETNQILRIVKVVEVTDQMLAPIADTNKNGEHAREKILNEFKLELRTNSRFDAIVENEDLWIVMRELLNNALDAIRTVGDPFLALSAVQTSEGVSLFVTDNGGGIKVEQQKNPATTIGGFGQGFDYARGFVMI